MKIQVHMIAFILLVIGGVNWGLIGIFQYNLVHALFGSMDSIEQIIYILVGISAIFVFATHMNDCKICMSMTKRKRR